MTSLHSKRSLTAASVLAAASTTLAPTAAADVVLPSILGDGMVLQRDGDAPIWGWAEPSVTVTVVGSWPGSETVSTPTDDRGRWRVDLPTPDAGGPYTVTIGGSGAPRVLRDVLIGEIWLCSGQSNMEWPVRLAEHPEREIADADHPRIRLFTVPNRPAAMPRIDTPGRWTTCSPASAAGFGATGYFFGRALHDELDVPIGLISADWGGTIVETWTSAEALWKFPEKRAALERLEAIADPTRRESEVRARVEAWWRDLDEGRDDWLRGAASPDDGWRVVEQPAEFAAADLESFDGIVYLRRAIELPPFAAGAPATLELGPIDDYDDVWINGVHVGATHEAGRWSTPRRYAVAEDVLRAGTNTIAVRVLDTGGLGGMNGRPEQLRMYLEGGATVSLAGAWQVRAGRRWAEMSSLPEGPRVHQNMPSVLFNGMIAPLVPFGVRGMIWYQGESNRGNAVRYRELFPSMITDWRRRWDRGSLPFYYVQIAPFRYGNDDADQTALLREAQLEAMRLQNTGMVVTTDIGNPADIHPRNKQAVGRRLAAWALAETYGRRDVIPSGPLYDGHAIEGDQVRIRFRYADGLELRDAPGGHFRVAGADRRFVDADAFVDGETVVVRSPEIAEPVAVRFGWEAAPEPNLFNGAGLPASPFRTDGWSP